LLYLAHRGGADISQLPAEMQAAIMATATEEERKQDASEKNYSQVAQTLQNECLSLRNRVAELESYASGMAKNKDEMDANFTTMTNNCIEWRNRAINRGTERDIFAKQVEELSQECGNLRSQPPEHPSDMPSRDLMAWELFMKYLERIEENPAFDYDAVYAACNKVAKGYLDAANRQREAKQ